MVLQQLLAEIVQRLAEDVGGLFDDARERNGVDDAALVVCDRVCQRERERREGLTAARGDVEREEAGGEPSLFAAGSQDFASPAIDRGVSDVPLFFGEMPVQAIEQLFARRALALAKLGAFRAHERLGVQEVRIHEARKEHPCVEGQREAASPVAGAGGESQFRWRGHRLIQELGRHGPDRLDDLDQPLREA